MSTVEYVCHLCNASQRWCVVGDDPHPIICCPRCRRPMSDAEGNTATMRSNALPARDCEECGTPYAPKREWQRFCSDACRWQAWSATHRKRKEATE